MARLRRIGLILLGAFALAALAVNLSSCTVFSSRTAADDLGTRLPGAVGPEAFTTPVGGHPVFRVECGERSAQPVVFIHGSPGSWDNFDAFLRDPALNRRFHLVAVDRPGFGNSGMGRAEPSVEAQAEQIATFFGDWPEGRSAWLVGHSLGGPVAVQIALDHPDRVAGLLLLAPSVDPELEVVRWYQHLGYVPPFRWLLPLDIRAANDEIYRLKRELEVQAARWPELSMPIVVIHGTADRLVPVENAAFVQEKAPHAEIILPDGGDHFLPWNQTGLIRDTLLEQVTASDTDGPAGEAR